MSYYHDNEIAEVKQALIEYGVATEKEIELVFNINGISIESLNDILYARTGLRDINDLYDDEEDYEY